MCRRNNVMLRFRNVFECNARLYHARTTSLAVKRHPEPAALPREDVNKTAPGESRAYSRPNKEFMVSLTKEKLYSRNRTICCSGSAGRLTITTHQPSLGLLCLFFAPEVRKQSSQINTLWKSWLQMSENTDVKPFKSKRLSAKGLACNL